MAVYLSAQNYIQQNHFPKRPMNRTISAPSVYNAPVIHPIQITESPKPVTELEGQPPEPALSIKPSNPEPPLFALQGFYAGNTQYPHPSLTKKNASPPELVKLLRPEKTSKIPPAAPLKPATKINLLASQEELFQSYLKGEKDWHLMVNEARHREQRRRSITLNDWGVKGESYEPEPFEDVVIRSGTDPCTAPGRGEFSDEDLTANTVAAWQRMRQQAKDAHLTIEEDQEAGFFRIPELNTIVWQPVKHSAPLLPDAPDFVKYNVTAATHPEVVDPSSAKPKFALEYIVAMVNKGQVGFSKPVGKWGTGYNRYETLIQMAKSTHHAMLKSGLAVQKPKDFNRLWQLCKMEKSPQELGIFKRGDSEEKILAGLRQEQALMQDLCRQSFVLAQTKLEKEMADLQKQIADHKEQYTAHHFNQQNIRESARLIEEVKDTYLRLDKIQTQLKIQMISKAHRKFAHNLFDTDPKKSVEGYLHLDDKLQTWMRELSAFLEAELIANKKRHQAQPTIYYPSWNEPLYAPTESLLPDDSELLTTPAEPLSNAHPPNLTTARKRSVSIDSVDKLKEE